MDKITPRHYWAVRVMGRFDEFVNTDPQKLDQAWKVLFSDDERGFWDMGFEDFLRQITARIEEINTELRQINAEISIEKSVEMGAWIVEGSD